MKAKKKEIREVPAASLGVDLAPGVVVRRLLEPPRRQAGVKVVDVAELWTKLHSEARRGLLAGQHRPALHPALAQRRPAHQQRAAADPLQGVGLGDAGLEDAGQPERRGHRRERPPQHLERRQREEPQQRGVGREDPLVEVDHRDARLELVDREPQLVVPGHVGAGDPGDLDGLADGLGQRVLPVEEHRLEAGLLGQVADRARADDHLDAPGGQLEHLGARLLGRQVGALLDDGPVHEEAAPGRCRSPPGRS